jgi:hypothetical protein
MSTTPATQLAQLRARLPDWRIIRTRAGVFIARHRVTGAHLQGRTAVALETQLLEWSRGRGH